jgi:voltage-gated potassium channel Kch
VRAVLAAIAIAIAIAAAAPARAQPAAARVTASASVVMPVSVGAGAVSVREAAGGVDVTRPLAVGGSVPWVLEVVEGAPTDADARRLTRAGFVRGDASAGRHSGEPVTLRLDGAPPAGPRPVTYVVATIN